mmetsp:Transcript_143252/g.202568  ORF Transcript_143252/g.202568 Transcript_143252/m.202568 type:complete len:299 (-) Transcript_143252:167-1063(-)
MLVSRALAGARLLRTCQQIALTSRQLCKLGWNRDSAGIVESTGLVTLVVFPATTCRRQPPAAPSTTATTTTAVQPFWIMASAGQNCNSACSAFDTADDSFECGKDEMGAINSTQAISDLLVSLNGTCDFADNGNLFRSNAGSPFILPNGDCYYWDPTKPPASIDCDTSPLSNVNRKPLCYCKPVEPADPDGGWFTGATNNIACDVVCNDNGYAECGEEEMAAINNTQAIEALAWELGIVCTVNSGDPSRNNAGTPFVSGNSCYYWDPTAAASQVDCSSVNSANRRPFCFCKTLLPEDR